MSRILGYSADGGVAAVPVTFSAGNGTAVWSLHPAQSASNPSILSVLAPYGAHTGKPAASAVLRSVAASIGGIGMTNTYEVVPTNDGSGTAGYDAPDAWTTTSSFGPFTNSSVLAVGAVAAAVPAGSRDTPVEYRPPLGPQPIPGTAYGFIASENMASIATTGPGREWSRGRGVVSYPTSSFITQQAGWDAGPWNSHTWTAGDPLALFKPSLPCACPYKSYIPGMY